MLISSRELLSVYSHFHYMQKQIVLFIHERDSVYVGLTELNGSKSNRDQLATVTSSLISQPEYRSLFE